jgi:uncharacterized iron-regulated membrane protein
MQQFLRTLHLWLGLTAGAFIVMMALSGTVIIFRSKIESVGAPRSTAAVPADGSTFAVMQGQLDTQYPGSRITKILFPETSMDVIVLQAEISERKKVELYADPGTGALLGPKKSVAWLDWLVDLHQNLLMGKTGRALTGIIGSALLLLSLSGLISWLAGQRDWKRTLAVPKGGPWRRVNYELHKWGGLWANLLLIVVSATGIILAYPDTFRATVGTVMGEVKPDKPAARAMRQGRAERVEFLPLETYLQTAIRSVPDSVVREVRMREKGRSTVTVTLSTPSDIRPKGGNTVILDASSGNVISVERSTTSPLSRKLEDYANAIHKAELGGLPVKIFWALLGLVPVALAISGSQIWWHQRKTAQRKKARMPSGAEIPELQASGFVKVGVKE